MPKSLLLADDSITIQKVVQITFASEDFQITSVDNGDAALEKIKLQRPHIVLADVVMPGKNGYDLCQTIKNDASLKGVPVILLAGTFEPFDPERAKAVGADDYIVKPFETQALIDKVKRLVGMEAGAANVAAPVAAAAKPAAATFAPPANPLFAKPAGTVGNMTPMAAPLPTPAPPAAAKPAASPFAGAGPLPAFGQQQKPAAPATPVPAKDPFGMGPMFGGQKPAAPAVAATPPPVAPVAAQPAQPQKQWDMNSFDEIPASHDNMPDIDMVDVEPAEVKPPPPAAKPAVAQAIAPKVAAAVAPVVAASMSEAQLKGPITDAMREIIEKIVWEVVPDLAETIIREELERILREKA